jgi:hypothetical protein
MTPIVTSAVLLIAFHSVGRADEKFGKVGVYLERTVEDQDSEVRFEVTGGDVGLATLRVVAPDGRTVIDFKAPDSKLGMRQVSLETPEPKNNGALQADFPEGAYRFTGSTVGGVKLQGEAKLSHSLPDATSFVHPRPDEKNLPVTGLQVRWSPVKNLAVWLVVIEHEATGSEFKVHLPATTTAVGVPDGFLAAGTKYKLAIGAVAKGGNTTFIETAFTTAAHK